MTVWALLQVETQKRKHLKKKVTSVEAALKAQSCLQTLFGERLE